MRVTRKQQDSTSILEPENRDLLSLIASAIKQPQEFFHFVQFFLPLRVPSEGKSSSESRLSPAVDRREEREEDDGRGGCASGEDGTKKEKPSSVPEAKSGPATTVSVFCFSLLRGGNRFR